VRRDKVVDTMAIQRYDVRTPEAEGGVFETYYWKATNTPLFDDAGALVYIMHAVENVTASVLREQAHERKERDAESAMQEEHQRLVTAVTALEASNAELAAFSYSVAHDLRAPLRGIQGFSQVLLEDYAAVVDARGREYLTRVATAAQRMSELIDDLLSLSRIARGPLSRVPVDLSAIATTVADRLMAEHDRPMRVTIASGLRATGDRRLLQIVFENLLGNAWKFTGKIADPAVEVGSRSIEGVTEYFVRDNGAGFDEAYASKLFAPFQRMHTDTEFAGTGIGLATVQRIVRRHGGRVWASATVNGGATIYFTLPD
jgi:light-regulated signal transduction histidine kinase (bacteriophytochrome)